MKGVVLTATGETLATPSPAELATLFTQSPRIGLGFTKIFESDSGSISNSAKLDNGSGSVFGGGERRLSMASTESDVDSPPPSPSERKEREWKEKGDRAELSDAGSSTSSGSASSTTTTTRLSTNATGDAAPPTRLRKPSMRGSNQRPAIKRTASNVSASASTKPSSSASSSSSSTSTATSKSLSRQKSSSRLQTTLGAKAVAVPVPASKNQPAPVYDLADEENLPSPFLKKIDKEGKQFGKVASSSSQPTTSSSSTSGGTLRNGTTKKRPSTTANGTNYLRAMAAANVVGKRAMAVSPTPPGNEDENVNGETARPALLNARKANEEARKALSRS